MMKSSESMIFVLKEEVPAYLRTGTLFHNLDNSDEERFEVPINCFKADPSVSNIVELLHLLHSARFWGLDEPPLTVASYIIYNHDTRCSKSLHLEFPEYEKFLINVLRLGTQPPEFVIIVAIKVDLGLHVFKHLYEQDGFQVTQDTFLEAAAWDKLPTVQWLLGLDFTWDKRTMIHMLRRGSINCLKLALEQEQPLPEGAFLHAAFFNDLKMMKFLLSIGAQPESYTMPNILHRGNAETMRFLRQAGCAWPQNTLSTLVTYDFLDCLIFAHEDGLPLTAGLLYQTFHCIPYCVWHGVMDIDCKLTCVSWVCVLLLRVGLWLTNHCANTVFTLVGLWAAFWTCGLVGITRGVQLATILSRLTIAGVAVKIAWDMWNEGVECLYE
eukprot:gene9520-11198_t